MTNADYEFDSTENKKIDSFTNASYILSYVFFASGAFSLVRAFPDFALVQTISGLVWVILGIAIYLPTDNFRKITETEGDDIRELMTGFNELKSGWSVAVGIMAFYAFAGFLDLFGVIG